MAGTRLSNSPNSAIDAGGARTDTGTILVCEDDKHLGFVIEIMLGEHGYRVLVAARPDEALEFAAVHDDAIDLLITDVDLGDMSGPELAQHLRSMRPEVEVLFVSGYSVDEVEHLRLPDGAAFLQKPFRPETLLEKARELLATSAV
jgi:two-component system cell cycle sensor histidine kinase/response regulator CckA